MSKIYFAGTTTQDMTDLTRAVLLHRPGKTVPTKILLSFHYFKKLDLDKFAAQCESPLEVFIDSGGFSAFTQGVDVPLADYMAFIKRWQHHITTYAVMDVIGDPVKTWENQLRMEDAGLSPLPCFHAGEPWEFLERYIDKTPYIALGGLVPYLRMPKKIIPWLIKAFQQAKGRAVFHGFGATSWQLASRLPWYSTDSSTWTIGPRFGKADLFNSKAGGFEQVILGDREAWKTRSQVVRKMGLDPALLATFTPGTPINHEVRTLLLRLIALGYMEAEHWLNQRHGIVTIPLREKGKTA